LEKVDDRLVLRLETLTKGSIVLHESEVVHCIERFFVRGEFPSREGRTEGRSALKNER
jgi:hypothetical protein